MCRRSTMRAHVARLEAEAMTNTRVIALPHDLPVERADDRNAAAGPNRARGQRWKLETSSPGDAALRAIVKLIARQAAEEDVKSQRVMT